MPSINAEVPNRALNGVDPSSRMPMGDMNREENTNMNATAAPAASTEAP
jgi:hypothetical protein